MISTYRTSLSCWWVKRAEALTRSTDQISSICRQIPLPFLLVSVWLPPILLSVAVRGGELCGWEVSRERRLVLRAWCQAKDQEGKDFLRLPSSLLSAGKDLKYHFLWASYITCSDSNNYFTIQTFKCPETFYQEKKRVNTALRKLSQKPQQSTIWKLLSFINERVFN